MCLEKYPMTYFISIHAPAKGATLNHVENITYWQFQSTLPRRERRVELFNYTARKFISIHAPAKGATVYRGDIYLIHEISIHAPAKGATL